ncbi:MAG: hypothetical protein AAFV80_21680, partial [Bacteroidota bacterium]
MSAKVSSFEKVKLGDYQYLFLLVAWSDYCTSVKAEVDAHVETFGENMGDKGLIVQAYDKDKWNTGEQVLLKNWGALQRRIQNELTPFLLIIDTDFDQFDPQSDNWSIIWISDYQKDEQAVAELFFSLQRQLKRGKDLFAYLDDLKGQSESAPILTKGNNPHQKTFQLSNKAFVDGNLQIHLNRIKEAIQKGDTATGLAYLDEMDLPTKQAVLLLQNRMEKLRVEWRKGVIT